MLSLLTDNKSRAEQNVVARAMIGDADAAVWVLLGADDDVVRALPAQSVFDAAVLFGRMPYWVQRDYSVAFADALHVRGDNGLVLQVADRLIALAEDPSRQAAQREVLHRRGNFLRARVDEARGDVERAIVQYAEAGAELDAGKDQQAIAARFRHLALQWRQGQLRTEEAVRGLEVLISEWPEGQLADQMRLALSRAYRFDGRPVDAVRTAVPMIAASSSDFSTLRAREAVIAALEDVFVTQPSAPLVVRLESWSLARGVVSPDPQLRLVMAQTFAAAAMNETARAILAPVGADGLSAEQQLQLAETHLAIGDTARAAAIVAGLTDVPIGAERRVETLKMETAPGGELAGLLTEEVDPAAAGIALRRSGTARRWTTAYLAARRADSPDQAVYEYLAAGDRPGAGYSGAMSGILAQAEDPAPLSAADFRAQLAEADRLIAFTRSLSRPSARAALKEDAIQ